MRIEIVLVEAWARVRRVVEVPDAASLAVLHEVVQEAMGWEHSHLHEFEVNGVRYGLPDPGFDPAFDTETLDESTTSLAVLLNTGDVAEYVYDFGDNWRHRLTVEAISTPSRGCATRAASPGRVRAHPRTSAAWAATNSSCRSWPTRPIRSMLSGSSGGGQTSSTRHCSTSARPTPRCGGSPGPRPESTPS
jgi:hypothetical protein